MTNSVKVIAMDNMKASDISAIEFTFGDYESECVFGDFFYINPLFLNKEKNKLEEYYSGCQLNKDSARLLYAALGAFLGK